MRIGSKQLAVCNPEAIENIFGAKNGRVWCKGDFYDGFDSHYPYSRTDGFSERDEAKNSERR